MKIGITLTAASSPWTCGLHGTGMALADALQHMGHSVQFIVGGGEKARAVRTPPTPPSCARLRTVFGSGAATAHTAKTVRDATGCWRKRRRPCNRAGWHAQRARAVPSPAVGCDDVSKLLHLGLNVVITLMVAFTPPQNDLLTGSGVRPGAVQVLSPTDAACRLLHHGRSKRYVERGPPRKNYHARAVAAGGLAWRQRRAVGRPAR